MIRRRKVLDIPEFYVGKKPIQTPDRYILRGGLQTTVLPHEITFIQIPKDLPYMAVSWI